MSLILNGKIHTSLCTFTIKQVEELITEVVLPLGAFIIPCYNLIIFTICLHVEEGSAIHMLCLT